MTILQKISLKLKLATKQVPMTTDITRCTLFISKQTTARFYSLVNTVTENSSVPADDAGTYVRLDLYEK